MQDDLCMLMIRSERRSMKDIKNVLWVIFIAVMTYNVLKLIDNAYKAEVIIDHLIEEAK